MKEKRYWELFHKNGDKDFKKEDFKKEDFKKKKPEEYGLFRLDQDEFQLDLILLICKELKIDIAPTIKKYTKSKTQAKKEALAIHGL